MSLVNGSMGELVGKDYVAALLPAVAKAKMDELVANLKPAWPTASGPTAG